MRRIDPILGEVKRCSRCREEWPNDEEFFYRERTSGRADAFDCYCRACRLEKKADERRRKRERELVAA